MYGKGARVPVAWGARVLDMGSARSPETTPRESLGSDSPPSAPRPANAAHLQKKRLQVNTLGPHSKIRRTHDERPVGAW